MKKNTGALLLLLLLVTYSVGAVAQELWTMEKCIEYAYQNNLQLKQSLLGVESADHDVLQSKLNVVPSLNASISQNFGWGRSPDPQTNIYANQQTQQSFFSINSDVTLFNGLQQINNIRQKQFDFLAQKYDSDKLRNDISLNIAAGYLLILFNLELVNNAERQVSISKNQMERTKKQVEAGAMARGALYDIQAQEAGEEANLVNNKNKLMLAYLDLMQMLDLEASPDFDIEKPKIEITGTPSLLPPEMIYNKSVTFMPEIKSAEYRVKSAERTVSLAKGQYSPRIFASGSYSSLYSNQIRSIVDSDPIPVFGDTKPFDQQLNDNRNGVLVFGLSIPIFNGYQVTTNVRKSRIFEENAQLNLEIEKNILRKNIEQAYADAIAAYQTYIARKKSVESFQEAFNYMEEKFNVGMTNSTDYNIAKLQLSSAESDLASSKYDYIFKSKILDFYLGKSLTLSDIANVQE
ncbi:MAG: TolC family protein [Bacteroidales bacterium]|nr:TolC family protein [Bacteroidales bacterium]MCF6342066.1 TolC family protein [Bacteroidales bacterium]